MLFSFWCLVSEVKLLNVISFVLEIWDSFIVNILTAIDLLMFVGNIFTGLASLNLVVKQSFTMGLRLSSLFEYVYFSGF